MLKWREILDTLDIPFYLNQSTAFGIYRDGENFENNRSLDLGVLGSDLSIDLINELTITGHVSSEQSHEREVKFGLRYFEDAFVELQPVFFKNGKAFYNLHADLCLWWPEEYLLKEKWGKITYLGLEWNIPGQIEKYLAHYYGDWKTPKDSWSWTSESKNLVTYKEL